ncbi:molybdenum cofactor guanylyltransferase MobA [Ideonella livida]|uniref:Molybdenum cofactor guanylyltransferase n=1 Tax=Ideonella livida TaxID=2707176 RepID=A0A7C9TL83_9BURK|nr:molybdenum cofactor guanylyltransferase MobA [Ideonella livida]NDY91845.1 molybdenum cofactor guanylyltransferase MobA [Ideonella livida]
MTLTPPSRDDITGLILAGGRGSRMGGVDKGLQNHQGMPLALHALLRLQPQVGQILLNANRNLAAYESFGVPVWPDALPDYPGPLAGFMAGLAQCETPWLVTVPCDSPRFPADLVARLAQAAAAADAEVALAATREPDGSLQPQPVFCLLRAELLDSLNRFIASGRRRIDVWTAQHRQVLVPFDQPHDDPDAFFNANTLEELRLGPRHAG